MMPFLKEIQRRFHRYRFEDLPPETREAVVQVKEYEESRDDRVQESDRWEDDIADSGDEFYERVMEIAPRAGRKDRDGRTVLPADWDDPEDEVYYDSRRWSMSTRDNKEGFIDRHQLWPFYRRRRYCDETMAEIEDTNRLIREHYNPREKDNSFER